MMKMSRSAMYRVREEILKEEDPRAMFPMRGELESL